MREATIIRYVEGKGSLREFVKTLVLRYAHLKPAERMDVVLARSAKAAIKAVELFSTTTPNVSLFIVDNDSEVESWSRHDKIMPSCSILAATEDMMINYGIRSPFDSGFIFPTDVEVDLEADLGLDEEKLAELEVVSGNWDFNAHAFNVDELLGLVFLLFKKLIQQEDLPNDLKLSDQRLVWFLCVCRAFYNVHVSYHSYWHSVDVAQSTYTLTNLDPEVWSLCPAKRLAVVLAALGHDMKHPGIVSQVISKVDENFLPRWASLESFHADVFDNVLSQFWPNVKRHWNGVVHEAIAATELAKHQNYLSCPRGGSISYVHALKISDVISAARRGNELYDHTAFLVFNEFYNQAVICRRLGNRYDFPPQKIDLSVPLSESFNTMQTMFLTVIILPYFEWITQHLPWFKKHLDTARAHYRRFMDLKEHDQLLTPEEYLGTSLVHF